MPYEQENKELRIELGKVTDELNQLKRDAYYMRYHIHQQGLHDWQPDARKKMESILYDSETNKLKS